jgi:uncharacterized protein HemY
MEEFAATKEKDTNWWDRLTGVNAFLAAATAYEKLGKPERAVAVLKRALVIFEDPKINRSASYIARRLAHTRAMLAKLLVKSEPETAKSLAKEALLWYRQAGGYDAVIAELEAI